MGKKKLIVFLSLSSIVVSVQATPGWHLFHGFSQNLRISKTDPNFDYHRRLPLMFVDDITTDQNLKTLKLTKAQEHQALVWGLNKTQEKRYVLLMQNRTGFYFKDHKLTPVEVLGFNARNDQERNQYAAQATRQSFEYNAKLLAFNSAFHRAAVRLKNQLRLPIILPFNTDKYSPYHYKPIQPKPGDRYLLFIQTNDSVKTILSFFIKTLPQLSHVNLNIYFLGKKIDQRELDNWAERQNIPQELIQEGKIQLKPSDKQLKKTPLLIRIHHNKKTVINLDRF